jgi:heme O synthase-like polyprenyltransferase
MKKIYYIILFFIFSSNNVVFWTNIKNELLWATDSSLAWWDLNNDNWLTALWALFVWLKTELMAIVSVVAVAIFIFIGIKMATARWNPEEFKKAWLHFVYAIIWIFVVFMAYWAVTLISNLNL